MNARVAMLAAALIAAVTVVAAGGVTLVGLGHAHLADRRDDQIAGLKRAAASHARRGQPRPAAEIWEKVIALQPGAAADYISPADAQAKAGRLDAALAALVKAAELDGVAEVHLRLADVLARLGRSRESALARETYQRLRLDDFERQARR